MIRIAVTVATTAFASAITLLAGATGAVAQGAPVEIKYATSAPPKTVWAMQVERFQKVASESSKGTLKIEAFLNSQLGSEQDTIQQVARGRIDMGGYSVSAGSLIVPELSLIGAPFLYKDAAEHDCVLDNHIGKLADEMFAKKGLKFLGWSEVGTTHFIGKKPILTPDDIKGVKARSQPTKIGAFTWTAFGANPNPLPVTEWNSAFQSGLIEVADSGPTYYVFGGLNKLAPVITLTAHQNAAGVVLMNKAFYDKLTPDQQKAIVAAQDAAPSKVLRAEVRGFEEKILEMHKAGGGTVATVTADQREVWRKGIQGTYAAMVDSVGGEAPAMWKAIQDGIKACSK